MAKMKWDTPLDYAVFQLSPKRSRCELFVSHDGNTEKLASGLLKPFAAHLKIVDEQVAVAAQSVKIEVGRHKNTEVWFNKGTLERFVRFVSTPEVLENVNTFDTEMSHLEAAKRIYAQGRGDQIHGGREYRMTTADDVTKKELLRAIDVRLIAVQKDLSAACVRAIAAGFNIETVSELQIFSDRFGAHRLNSAATNFISVCERRPDLLGLWKSESKDADIRSSFGSDMSIDDDPPSPSHSRTHQCQQEPVMCHHPSFPSSKQSGVYRDFGVKLNKTTHENQRKEETSVPDQTPCMETTQRSRRLSVLDRINSFENKQKEGVVKKPVSVKPVELRLSSDRLTFGVLENKTMMRRWSGASDMSIDLCVERMDNETLPATPLTSAVTRMNSRDNQKDSATSSSLKSDIQIIPSSSKIAGARLKNVSYIKFEEHSESVESHFNSETENGLNYQVRERPQSLSMSKTGNEETSEKKYKGKTVFGGKIEDAMGLCSLGKLKSSQRDEITFDNKHSSSAHVTLFGSKNSNTVDILNEKEVSESRDHLLRRAHWKIGLQASRESGTFEGDANAQIREAVSVSYKEIEDALCTNPEVRSVRENIVTEKKELGTYKKASSSSISSVENSGPHGLKFDRQDAVSELAKKEQLHNNGSMFTGVSTKSSFSGKSLIQEDEGTDSFYTPPSEKLQKGRSSKGNQEHNEELKLKAKELEDLFAQHTLRVHGDQSNSGRKGRSAGEWCEPATNFHCDASLMTQFSENHQSTETFASSKNMTHFNAVSTMKTIASQKYCDSMTEDISDLHASEGSRGKFYTRYMQKRDAKLREEWSSNRIEKEVRLKSMQDSFERSRYDMKIKLSGSADRKNLSPINMLRD